MQGAKAVTIGAQRITQDPAVQPVVLGARYRKPVPETIELLRVGRKDRKAAFQKCFNHRPMRHLDGDRNRRRRGSCGRQQPITKGAKASTAMGKSAFPNHRAVGPDSGISRTSSISVRMGSLSRPSIFSTIKTSRASNCVCAGRSGSARVSRSARLVVRLAPLTALLAV
jgi:hypothetical protein